MKPSEYSRIDARLFEGSVMVAVEHFVTEWGFPAVRWEDRIVEMGVWPEIPSPPGTSQPRERFPDFRSRDVTRTLWVHSNGVQVLYKHPTFEGVIGHWGEWDSLVGGSTRDALTGEALRLLGSSGSKFVEHQTLTAYFSDGTVNRIATSAVSKEEMEALHRVIDRAFLVARANYAPPEDGTCWRRILPMRMAALGPGETSETRLDVDAQECRRLRAMKEPEVLSAVWVEPVATRSSMGLGGLRHHLVWRILFVGEGFRPGRPNLRFVSYKPGDGGVVEVDADFAFLKGFRVIDSEEAYARDFQPIESTLPGLSVVADFRYGVSAPLTCATFAPGVDARAEVEGLAEKLRSWFLPFVGQSLTNEQLGLKSTGKA